MGKETVMKGSTQEKVIKKARRLELKAKRLVTIAEKIDRGTPLTTGERRSLFSKR